MYSGIDISTWEENAIKFVMDNDRSLFKVFFDKAEEFCTEESVVIGGRVGIDLIVGREISKDSFFWELYCDDTYNTARALGLALAQVNSPHISSETVSLQTNIKHLEFTIYIYGRMLFKIYSLDKYRGIKLIELMGPITRPGYFGHTVKCLPEEIQLIDIYRTLYLPSKLSMWKEELDNERRIYELIRGSLGDKAAIVGAGDNNIRNVARDLAGIVIKKLCQVSSTCNNSPILIGDYALKMQELVKNANRIQFISSIDIADITKMVNNILANINKGSKFKTTFVRYPLNIPSDFQIMKYTIYVSDNRNNQIPIIDVFNSSAFEMIPYTIINNVKVATKWVILRFLFIDIWILKLIMNLSKNTGLKSKVHELLRSADMLRDVNMISDDIKYDGVYINESVAKKKRIKEISDIFFPIYYPAKDLRKAKDILNKELQETPTVGVDTPDQLISDEPVVVGAGIELFTSSPIDITIDPETKKKILLKIVGSVRESIMDTLESYAASTKEYSRWGVGKDLNKYFLKNRQFLPFLSHNIKTVVDIGCGNGMDLAALEKRYRVHTTCVDIEDNRSSKYKNSEFCKAILGEPYNIPDEVADLITVFHSIHHMQEDVAWRMKDIYRICKPSGLVFIKDHDVLCKAHASNVDFEHLVYHVGETKVDLAELIEHFDEHIPMTYYSAEMINTLMIDAGFNRIFSFQISPNTRIYGAVYRRD